MTKRAFFYHLLFLVLPVVWLISSEVALATQAHGAPEGIYAHQIAHAFFAGAMVIFIYWVRQRRLILHKGWRYIQYSAIFLILWNINVVLVHLIDEQLQLVTVESLETWKMRITSSAGEWLEIYYYCSKMDHLLCVPALLFLFLGLRRLLLDSERARGASVL